MSGSIAFGDVVAACVLHVATTYSGIMVSVGATGVGGVVVVTGVGIDDVYGGCCIVGVGCGVVGIVGVLYVGGLGRCCHVC